MGRGRSSSPVLKKKTASGVNEGLRFAMSAMQGWRLTMEDTHRVSLKLPGDLNDWAYAGLFDGHAGKKVATYASKNLLPKILKNINNMPDIGNRRPPNADQQTQITNAISQGFLNLDKTMSKSRLIDDTSGSTAVCAMISPTHMYIAHCGDSRAVLSRGGRVHFATSDHKPSNKLEKERIEAAGGFVARNRVRGRLAMSRALGDFEYKKNPDKPPLEQSVISKPDVTVIERNDLLDEFVVLACDGIFDVMSNSDLISFIRNQMSKTKNLKTICNRVIDHCFAIGSTDNMSIIILTLPGCPSKEELKRKRKSDLAEMNRAIRAKKARMADDDADEDDDEDDEPDANSDDDGDGRQQRLPGNDNNNNQVEPVNNVVIPEADGPSRPDRRIGNVKNAFIIYFLDYWKRNGGNVCEAAKRCGENWSRLPKTEKQKYRRRYLYAKRVSNRKNAAAGTEPQSNMVANAS